MASFAGVPRLNPAMVLFCDLGAFYNKADHQFVLLHHAQYMACLACEVSVAALLPCFDCFLHQVA
jgi:hypothetical protein